MNFEEHSQTALDWVPDGVLVVTRDGRVHACKGIGIFFYCFY